MADHNRLAIEFISGLGLAPPAFVELAARLGCAAIGLAPAPIVGPVAPASGWSLRGNSGLVAETKRALADNGVALALGDGFLIMPGTEIAAAAADFDLFAQLGAERLNVVVLEPDAARATDQFALFASMAAERGLPVTVEFMPQMPCGTLAQAVALVKASGAANAAVMVDAMHLFGSGSSAADLAALDRALLGHVQLCDARIAGFYAEYYDDARCNRTAPGEGVLPLADFIAAVPAGVTIGLELPMLARAEAGESIDALLAPAVATARALLAKTTVNLRQNNDGPARMAKEPLRQAAIDG